MNDPLAQSFHAQIVNQDVQEVLDLNRSLVGMAEILQQIVDPISSLGVFLQGQIGLLQGIHATIADGNEVDPGLLGQT